MDNVEQALADFRHGVSSGRVAHAYLLLGDPRGAARELAARMLELLFCRADAPPCGGACEACRQVRERRHADILWIEPESKSRQIRIEDIREKLIPRIQQCSFEGGWKAGVLLNADRMREAAANALLKTLEEPPERTLLLLLTDAPQYLLPTIVSRCQKIRVMAGAGALPSVWQEQTLEILAGTVSAGPSGRLAKACRFKELLDDIRAALKKEAKARGEDEDDDEGYEEDGADAAGETKEGAATKQAAEARLSARLREARAEVLRMVLYWQRDVLWCAMGLEAQGGRLHYPEYLSSLRRQAEGLPVHQALRQVRAVEAMSRQLDSMNMGEEQVLEAFFAQVRGV